MKHVKFLFLAMMVFAAAFVSSAVPALASPGQGKGDETIVVGDKDFEVVGGGKLGDCSGYAGTSVNNRWVYNATMGVYSGGTANNTIIYNPGTQYVYDQGTANYTHFGDYGALQSVEEGGTANDTLIENYCYQYVYGTANRTTINVGGQYVYTSGTANYTTLNLDSTVQEVYGGEANYTTIDYGAQGVYNDGTANNMTINSSGFQSVYSGTASDTVINGGQQSVYSGTANRTTVNSGRQDVYEGGTASDTTVNPGGSLYLQNGATLSGDIRIMAGGYLYTESGGGSAVILETGATLTLATTTEWNVTNNFACAGSIVKTGSGIFNLKGANNTYTGGTVVSEGELTGGIGSGALTVAADATYNAGAGDATVASLSGGGTVSANAITVETSGDFYGIVNGSLNAGGAWNVTGDGTLTVNGNLTVLVGGSWDLAGAEVGKLTVNGNIAFNSATWELTRGDQIDISGGLTGFQNVKLTVTDPSEWTLNESVEILSFGSGSLPGKYNAPGDTFDVPSDESTYTFNAVVKEGKKLFLTLVPKTAPQPGGSGNSGGGGTVLSSAVTPLEVYTKIASDDKGTERKIVAEKQPDEITFALILPAGTDLTKLPVYFSLPDGATMDPKSGTERDFTTGPLSYTVKAENGVTTGNYFVTAKLETVYSVSVERACFVTDPALCSIVYDENADESFAAVLSIPYLSGMDGKNITSLKATLTGLDLLAPFTCAWNNANCLQITLKLADPEILKRGRLEKIDYWLTGDGTNYVQTYTPPLDLSKVPLTAPLTPEPNSNHKGGGGGCDAGYSLFGSLLLTGLARLRISRKGEMEK